MFVGSTIIEQGIQGVMEDIATYFPHPRHHGRFRLANGEETVSYTHLDVYKRQVRNASRKRTAKRGGSCARRARPSPGDTLVAVSYTHLDVYKRQASMPWRGS